VISSRRISSISQASFLVLRGYLFFFSQTGLLAILNKQQSKAKTARHLFFIPTHYLGNQIKAKDFLSLISAINDFSYHKNWPTKSKQFRIEANQ